MKNRTIQEKAGRAQGSKILKTFTVSSYPSDFDELVKMVKDDKQAQSTVFSLFDTQFAVFTRTKIDNGKNITFLEAIKVERKTASADTRRKLVFEDQLAASELVATGKITVEEFQVKLAGFKALLSQIDKDEAEAKVAKLKKSGADNSDK